MDLNQRLEAKANESSFLRMKMANLAINLRRFQSSNIPTNHII